jgi:hypothetical protein
VDWQTVISTVVGTFVGVLAGWMITHFYAQLSSQELKREAESLRHLTTLILRGLEEAGFVEFSRDEQGGSLASHSSAPFQMSWALGMVWR